MAIIGIPTAGLGLAVAIPVGVTTGIIEFIKAFVILEARPVIFIGLGISNNPPYSYFLRHLHLYHSHLVVDRLSRYVTYHISHVLRSPPSHLFV